MPDASHQHVDDTTVTKQVSILKRQAAAGAALAFEEVAWRSCWHSLPLLPPLLLLSLQLQRLGWLLYCRCYCGRCSGCFPPICCRYRLLLAPLG